MNAPLDPSSAEVVARVRGALDEVAATTSSPAPVAVGGPARHRGWMLAAAAACVAALAAGSVVVLRSNDREPLRPSATEPVATMPTDPTDSAMPYFLAAADLPPGPITTIDWPLSDPTHSVSVWARNGDPTEGIVVAWAVPAALGAVPAATRTTTTFSVGEWRLAVDTGGVNDDERSMLIASITEGSGVPWVLAADGWELIALTTGADDPGVEQRFGDQTYLSVGAGAWDFYGFTGASTVRHVTVAGQPGWVSEGEYSTVSVMWREPDTGRWARLLVPPSLTDRVDGLIAAVVPNLGGDERPTTSVPAPVEDQLVRVVSVTGDVLPVYDSSAGADPALGLPIPTIQTSAGEFTVDGPTLFVFVAHWCPHCNAELPRLIDGLASNAFGGARVVLVSTAEAPTTVNYPADEWLASRGWTGEVLYDASLGDGAAGELAQAFGASAWPYFVMVNSEGAVTARATGERDVDDVVDLITTTRLGETIGRLVIDGIDVEVNVLDGGGDHVATLKMGPILTFDRETGTPTIVGHRTTFGAPFLRLDELQIGDRFTFTTLDGTRTFEVTLVDRCDGDEPCPVRDEDDLLLAAYDPAFTSTSRLTVHAREIPTN